MSAPVKSAPGDGHSIPLMNLTTPSPCGNGPIGVEIIDLITPPSPSAPATRRHDQEPTNTGRRSSAPDAEQPHHPQAASKIYTFPDGVAYNPETLLADVKEFLSAAPLDQPELDFLTEEDLEAAQILMQLHTDDASLANQPTPANPVSDDSQATIPDDTINPEMTCTRIFFTTPPPRRPPPSSPISPSERVAAAAATHRAARRAAPHRGYRRKKEQEQQAAHLSSGRGLEAYQMSGGRKERNEKKRRCSFA